MSTPEDPRPDVPSILDAIEARSGSAPRVRLREDDESPPDLAEVTLHRRGRYRVLGQIAEGGVGQILKGHDVDLNRDVALKMLRERHVDNADLVRRFVEEAQIGGQLQHPGLVPVHELGIDEDRRPYFSMKLVKGRTLAALLAARQDPGDERRRFVSYFLRTCETVAYAHSRGVIHRDLKSSNVMVGAFGEVQVVDWGFAKVLAQGGVADERKARREPIDMTRIATVRSGSEGSESIAGAVMGTPAYMPPEQALGHVDDLDERSDVFALGAILCEILTGQPAYVGPGHERLNAAADGRIEDAVARLHACGAEAGLVRLAEKCLSPLRRDRPRDAGAVARGLSRYLAAAEEREKRGKIAALEAREETAKAAAEADEQRAGAEEARTRAAKQRAKLERNRARAEKAREVAEDARKSRRRTLVIAAAVLLVVIVGAFAFIRIASGRVEHERQTAIQLDGLLERARLLQGRGEWDEALAVLGRARDLLPADERIAAVERGVREARQEDDAARRLAEENRLLAERLEATILGGGGAKEIAAAFGESKVDPRTPTGRGDLAERTGIVGDVTTALEVWAWNVPKGAERTGLLALARKLDPDATRDRLRLAAGQEDWTEMLDLAARDETEPVEARTAELLGLSLVKSGRSDKAVEFLRRAHHRRPDRPWTTVLLARALLRLDLPRIGEARRLLASALVTRPDCAPLEALIARQGREGNDLDAFRARVGFRNEAEWCHVDVSWSRVTGRKRRIYFEKRAVTEALMNHRGGVGEQAAPMVYGEKTVFVAESFDREGKVFRTEAIRVRWPAEKTEFLVFDEEGNRTNEFRKNREMAPRVCAGCHLPKGSRGYFPPMMDFPSEGEESRLEIADRYRNAGIVLTFLEGYHCGSNLFGPYGAIWLSKLRADAKDDRLSGTDREHYNRLRVNYAHLLDG